MARDPSTFLATAQGYQGQLPGQAISLAVPIAGEIRSVPIIIDWRNYGAPAQRAISIEVSLRMGIVGQPPFDRIRSIIIDNTASLIPIYVYFPDTQISYLCPPNTTIQTPVITGNMDARIYAEGFIEGYVPRTTVHFTNAIVPPFSITDPIGQPAFYTDNGASHVDFPFGINNILVTGIDIGTPSDNRVVAYVLMAELQNSTGALTLSSVTAAFGSMQIAEQRTSQIGNTSLSAIVFQNIPTGTTTQSVFTFSTNIQHLTFGCYSIYGAQQLSPVDTEGNSGIITARNVVFGGFAGSVTLLGGTASNTAAVNLPSWANATQDFIASNLDPPPPYLYNTGASRTNISSAPQSYYLTNCNTIVGAVWR